MGFALVSRPVGAQNRYIVPFWGSTRDAGGFVLQTSWDTKMDILGLGTRRRPPRLRVPSFLCHFGATASMCTRTHTHTSLLTYELLYIHTMEENAHTLPHTTTHGRIDVQVSIWNARVARLGAAWRKVKGMAGV